MSQRRVCNGSCMQCGVAVPPKRSWCTECYAKRRAAKNLGYRLAARADGRVSASAKKRYWANPEEARVRVVVDKLHRRGPVGEGTEDAVRALRRDPCSYCGGPGGTIDHIDPNGPSAPENLTAACAACNRYKQRMALLPFLMARPLLEKRDEIHHELLALGLRRHRAPTMLRAKR